MLFLKKVVDKNRNRCLAFSGKFVLFFCDYPEAELRRNLWPLIHQATQRRQWKATERRLVERQQHRIDNGPAIVVAEDQPPEQDFLSILCSPVTVTHTPQPPLPKAVQGLHGTCPGARTGLRRGPQGTASCWQREEARL